MIVKSKAQSENFLDKILNESKTVLRIVFIFAFAVNLLNLITPLYSLQVLDRVLSSRSYETLITLTLIMIVLQLALHLLQVTRSFTLIKLGEWLDNTLSPTLFSNAIKISSQRSGISASYFIRELQQVKMFLTSSGINTVFDAPWSIIYIIVLFVIHPWMGWLAIVGAIISMFFAFLNAYTTNSKLGESSDVNQKAMATSDIAARNAEAIEAMGMMKAVMKNWQKYNNSALKYQSDASYANSVIRYISLFVRAILQMMCTALGAYLTITPDVHTGLTSMTAGGMIASSIILGRALSPFDQIVDVWKQIHGAFKSYGKIREVFGKKSDRHDAMSLPRPEGLISAENVSYAIPTDPALGGQPRFILKGLSFQINPGDVTAIIGPSAAGKSTLAKILVGIWKATQGSVRLDGADVYTWGRDNFGKYVGYLPQDVELFSGTIKDNIARLDQDADPELVVEAAKLSGAHELILKLPNGYETDIGVGGASLSGGQRQRIGLARAFYGRPRVVVLDEPNASLDELGEQALANAVMKAKEQKITTIIISHRPSILAVVDKILMIQDGLVAAFGPKEDIFARFAQKPAVNNDENGSK